MKSSPFFAAAALTTVFTAPAFAADLMTRPVAPVAPVMTAPLAYNWTACYVGINGGGLWVDNKWTNEFRSENGPRASSIDASGGLFGGQVGCNYQVNSWVFGAQVDEDWTDASGSARDPIFTSYSDEAKVTSLGSATLRGGFAWDRALLYVKGGFAWETNKYSSFSGYYTGSDTRTGATVGGGLEYGFTQNLTGFIEYDYYDFGSKNVTLTYAGGGEWDRIHMSETKNVVKVGLNLKFDLAAPAPVAAKY